MSSVAGDGQAALLQRVKPQQERARLAPAQCTTRQQQILTIKTEQVEH
eukprot:CAMPEP_0194508244 /NCGR_PEP_ID=MMETSP0253-20130528/38254_1 /TAXON_ID=2966 /ORGANISM="Noctiluca scintillans" /LENGTH=47 /DNA_ID= /DNA_START= /DNA_END= /DNA_ORIENTATION=